ncbi:MAG TPA: hypothetical protein VD884_06665 [Ohtaekwangia sp.]|nr:hypothetical protein [Ohtaekwangia sp.]
MTKNILLILALLFSVNSFAQQKFFRMYTDSTALIHDANYIVADFTKKVNAISPVFTSRPTAILNTKPFLIFYSSKSNTVNLPIWRQVIPEQKKFFQSLAGNEQNGQEIFGLFFNGFYLPHELGHALQKAANKSEGNLYQNEYFANIVAVLYWREVKRTNELHQCYEYANQIVRQLPNPVPEGEDPIKYFNEHYEELGADPYKYGYFQFAQFKKIYEDKSLKSFDEFINAYLIK